METFFAEYKKQLEIAMKRFPLEYLGGVPFCEVLDRMRIAIQKGTFNKDGRAFVATCKALGIKHTYKAIAHFIANHV